MPQPKQTPRRRRWQIRHADCLKVLPTLQAASVDAVITDPPCGIACNGMQWDRPAHLDPGHVPGKRRRRPSENPNQAFQGFSREWSSACLHSLKPGGLANERAIR
jgi:site-specific DNA-methyltransferase (adenine-specific)